MGLGGQVMQRLPSLKSPRFRGPWAAHIEIFDTLYIYPDSPESLMRHVAGPGIPV